MKNASRRRALAWGVCRGALPALALLGGCSSLLPKAAPAPTLFSLDDAASSRGRAPPAAPGAPTLLVSPPRAATGFDTPRIVYVRQTHELQAFAYNQWVGTPAKMLAPLIVSALDRSGAFRAVLLAPTTATGELRLDTELIRLQHEFGASPSQVRLTLRAVVIETSARGVLAWREFDAVVPAGSDDPYGGVVAANRAVATVLADLAAFCAQAAASKRAAH